MHTSVIRNDNQKVLTKEDIKQRWQEYFKGLLKVENERGDLDTAEPIEGPIEDITIEVRQAIKGMKMGKATEPTGVSAEQLKNLDDEGIEGFRDMLKTIAHEGEIPRVEKELHCTHLQRERRPNNMQEPQRHKTSEAWTKSARKDPRQETSELD